MQGAAVGPVDGRIHIAGDSSRFIQNRLIREINAESIRPEGLVRSTAGNDTREIGPSPGT